MAKATLTDAKVRQYQPEPSYDPRPYEIHDDKCPGLFLRVEKTGRKNFWLYLYQPPELGGKRYRWKVGSADTLRLFSRTTTSAADKAVDVRHIANQLKADAHHEDLRERRRAAREEAAKREHATLAAFIDGPYREFIEPSRKGDVASELKQLKGFFPTLEKKDVAVISEIHIRQWMTKANKKLAPATIHRRLGALAGVLSHAITQGLIDRHPLQKAEVKRSGIKIPRPDNKRVRFLSDDEEESLHSALTERDAELKAQRLRYIHHCQSRRRPAPDPITGEYADHLHPLVITALNTGVRRSGLFNLNWSDVDLPSIEGSKRPATLFVRASHDKAGKGYEVPLNLPARTALRAWRAQTKATGLVFPNPHTGEPLTTIKSAWGSLLTKAEIIDFRFHDCRHHFASKLVMNGINLNTVRELLGHASLEMTLRYAHLAHGHKSQAVEALG